jgi:hypothetical protein
VQAWLALITCMLAAGEVTQTTFRFERAISSLWNRLQTNKTNAAMLY